MDVKAVKMALSNMIGTLLAIDPLTGLPYVDPITHLPTGKTVRSNPQAPFSLAETDLPTWISFTGPGTYPDPPDRVDNTLAHETRDFTAALYVCVAEAGIDGEAERKTEPYLDAVRKLIQQHAIFANNSLAETVPGILRTYPLRDDGLVQLRYGQSSTLYLGLRFVIRVIGLNDNNYGTL